MDVVMDSVGWVKGTVTMIVTVLATFYVGVTTVLASLLMGMMIAAT